MRISVIGDGQMGLVLSHAFARLGHQVRLWGPFPADLAKIRQNPADLNRLPGFSLSTEIEIHEEDASALDGAELIINAIPTQFIRPVWERVNPSLSPGTPIICVSKGIEINSLEMPSDILITVASPQGKPSPVCVLSGPTIATELAQQKPAIMVAASEDAALSQTVQDVLTPDWLRIYRSDDVIGVELAGATKNVIALAAGMVDGLQLGDNAKSALLSRGLAEIARFGTASGAKVETFFGVAGVGDLTTTCFSPYGRNRTCGERIGRGETLDDILSSTASVVEGVPTTKAVTSLAQQRSVEMPITQAVYEILYENLSPVDAIDRLMQREATTERIG